MRPPMFPIGPPYMQSMPSIGIGTGMDTNMSVGMNMAMCMQPVMAPFGSGIPYLHINQTIQAPMLQIPPRHMAAEFFPYSHAGDPYHFPSIAPGQVSPQVKHNFTLYVGAFFIFHFRELEFASHGSSYSVLKFSIFNIIFRIQTFKFDGIAKKNKVNVLALVFRTSKFFQ